MSIYGKFGLEKERASVTLESTRVISESRRNAETVHVYTENGKYYVDGVDVANYMEAANVATIREAVGDIRRANGISTQIVVNCENVNDFFTECALEEGVMCEAAAEDNATNMKKTMQWYNKFITASKGKAESKAEIQDRIKVLKDCVASMERCRDTGEGKGKYVLKNLIPFNAIYRLIKRQDVYAGIGYIADLFTGFAGFIVRAASYEKMLQDNIDRTNEAIKFLEGKLKDFED